MYDYHLLTLLTSHRVEMLHHFESEAIKNEVIILEEPGTNLVDLLKGRITIEEYIRNLNTTFPLFTKYQGEMLKRLYDLGKEILQIEPYLKNLERIYKAIENNEFEEVIKNPDVEAVREIEKRATEALIRYHEAFLHGDFDGVVEATINFTRADAERFRMRDYMRAKEIAKILKTGKLPSKILMEAGQMHILLPEYLKKLLKEEVRAVISTISLPERIAEKIGLELVPNPGNELTRKYIIGEKVPENTEKLLAAKGLIYISLISKDEKMPTKENPYPHLTEEIEVSKFVNKLSYEDCKSKFEKIWKYTRA